MIYSIGIGMETAPNRYRFLEIDPYRYRYYKSYRYPISCLLPILYRYNLKESANFTDTDIPHIHPTDTDTDSRRLIHTDADPDSYRFFLYRYRVSVYQLIPGIGRTLLGTNMANIAKLSPRLTQVD